MGNWCCPAANPCDSVEERSGLLQQDASKAPVHTAETGVLGAFQDSPEAEVDVRKTSDEAKITEEEKVVRDQVKASPPREVVRDQVKDQVKASPREVVRDQVKASPPRAREVVRDQVKASPPRAREVVRDQVKASPPRAREVVRDQVKASPRAREAEPAKTQENGPIQQEHQQTGPLQQEHQQTGPLQQEHQQTGPLQQEHQQTGPIQQEHQQTGPIQQEHQQTGPIQQEHQQTGPLQQEHQQTGPLQQEHQQTGPIQQEHQQTGPIQQEHQQTGPIQQEHQQTGPIQQEHQQTGPIQQEHQQTGPIQQEHQQTGPIQQEHQQTEAPPPGKGAGLKADSTIIAQDNAEDTATDNRPFESLQCTLESPQTEDSTTDPQVSTEVNVSAETKEVVVEDVLAAAQDKIPDVSQESDEVPPENLTIRAEIQTEHVTPETVCDDDDKDEDDRSRAAVSNAVDRPSEDSSLCNEVLSSLPDSPLPAEACQRSSSVCGHEISPSSVSPSSAVMKDLDSENGIDVKERSPDDLLVKSHDTPEPSPGPDSTQLKHNDTPELSPGPHSGPDSTQLKHNDTPEPSPGPHSGPDSTQLKHNGVEPAVWEPVSTSPSAASESLNSGEHSKADLQSPPTGSSEVASSENLLRGIKTEETESRVKGEDKDVTPKAEEDGEAEEEMGVEREGEMLELNDKDNVVAGMSAVVEVDVVPVREQEELAEEGIRNSDEDLYRGAEELIPNQQAGPVPLFEITLPKVEARCSLARAVDVLSYSETEWKGNTPKSLLIRKGYKELSQRFVSLRRVRGDNYCALRATLFQLLSSSTELPVWLQQEDVTTLPKELEAREGLISQWTFPGECQQGEGDATQQLKHYMELLRNRWQAAVDCTSAEERQRLCERVFRGGEEELGLLEAVKLLMLGRAVELHASMQAGGDVPFFCWLLFARDSSECPRTFLSNHLNRVGFSGGLEQVEMFLLGYALQCTIQVYRLYMAETEEFVTYYPDDHKADWPSVCLVTEDDRHYNVPVTEDDRHYSVPVGDSAELPEELASS